MLKKHIIIHADGTGPFGEDEGAFVTGFNAEYADNIDNYEGLEGKGWDELDDEEQSWFDDEDDFAQLNPYWADCIVCIDRNIGQSNVNWCDWEMIFADLWIDKEDYDKVSGVHVVHYNMEVESTKQKEKGMLLSEAKEILKQNGFIVEDTDDSEELELAKDEITRLTNALAKAKKRKDWTEYDKIKKQLDKINNKYSDKIYADDRPSVDNKVEIGRDFNQPHITVKNFKEFLNAAMEYYEKQNYETDYESWVRKHLKTKWKETFNDVVSDIWNEYEFVDEVPTLSLEAFEDAMDDVMRTMSHECNYGELRDEYEKYRNKHRDDIDWYD